jgi:hypothetical protein
MIFDIESKKAVIVSNLSKNLWLVALILFSLFAIILLKVPAIGTAQVENLSDNSTLINETLVLPDIVNDTVNETQIINETIVDNNYTDEFVNNTSPDAVLINDTELPIDKNKFLVSIQGNTSANLTSNMDTAVRSFTPDTNYGTDTFVRVQTFSTANTRTFISFNLSSIPANATILSANLSLHRYSSGTITRTYNIHRVNASWSETVITWNNQVSVDGLTTSASVGVVDTWYTWDVISDVRGFMNGSYPNYGWRISDSAESSGTAYTSDFYSREYAVDTTLRPRLTVYYSIDTPPTTALVSPSNGNITTSNSVNFTCSATDDYKLTNITFYWNYAGSFIANETVNVSGTNNQTTFARNNLDKGDILWNCLACDNASQCSFASANWTVTIASMPLISFTNPTPANGAITSNISIIANISITNTSDLTQFIWNWNGTNYTFYSNSLMLLMNLDNVSVLGENATKAVDASRNGKNGTILGGAVYTSSGKYGGAYTFDGINDYINFSGRATSVTDNWALSAWIKPALLPQFSFAVYNGNDAGGYGFGISNGAGLSGSVLTGLYGAVAYINSGYTFASANTWYHVVMVRASGTTYFYVNGNQTASTGASVPLAPNDRLTIGNQMDPSNNPTRYFNGTIDEVRIYNRSLSADEVKQFYYSNFNKYDTDKWQFYTNETNLTSQGSYTYGGCANNTVGGNCTETRTIYMGDWTPPSISFTNPTPANGTITADTFAIINISITNASDLNEFKWKWNSTNYTFYNSSLVLMLNLDNISALGESSTKAVDVSPSSNNGTFTNTPTWTTSGKYSSALNFAGTTYVTTPITGFSASTGTVLMWIKPNKDLRTVTQSFFDTKPSVAGALRIYSNSDNTLRYETGGTLTPLAWTIPSDWTGQWHQIGLNWSGSATALIVDGAVVASGSNSQAPLITTFEIGRYNSGSNFNGTIDEVRVYSASLSPGELKQRYYSNLNKYDTDKWAFTTNQSNLTAGTYTYQGFAKDTNSNANQTDLNYLYIDLTAPTINFTSPTELPGSLINTRDNIIVNVTANDTNLANITIYLFNSTRSLLNATTTATSPNFVNFTSLANGLYYFNATARDTSGNSNSTETRNATISYDIINPLILVVYPQNTTYNLNVSVLNYTVFDANLQACWYSTNNGAANTTITCGTNVTNLTSTEGSNTWIVWANDTVGNRNSSQVTFSKDTISPTIVIIAPANATYNNKTQLVNISSNGNYIWFFNGTANETYTPPVYRTFNEGSNTIIAYANDTAGNFNTTSRTFSTDTIPPYVAFISPTNGTLYNYSQITVNITNSSDATYVWWYNKSVNLTYTGVTYINLTNGTHTFIVYANDSIGNLNATSVTFTINTSVTDVTPPLFNTSNTRPQPGSQYNQTNTIILVVNPSENSTVTANISWDATSQIVSLIFNGTQWFYNASFSNTLYPGTYTIVINATDIIGNSNTTTTNFTIRDTMAPSVTNIQPTAGTNYNQSQNVNITTNVTDWYYDSVQTVIARVIYPNGSSTNLTLTEIANTQIFDNLVLSDTTQKGRYNITIIANDTSGNVNNTETSWFSVNDVTPPQITILSPANQTYAVSSINFSVLSNENLSACLLTLNNWLTNYTMQVNISKTGSNYTNSSIADGSYTAKFWCNDTSNNINNTQQVTFSINTTVQPDTTYPVFSNFSDNNGSLVNFGRGIFNVTVQNTNGTVWLEINNVNITATNTSNRYNVSYNFVSAGVYAYRWWAYGNGTSHLLNNSDTRYYTVIADTEAPNITSTLISPYDPATGYNVTLNATATDNIGISGIFVNITLPNSTVITRTLPMANYTIQTAGRHNVTFWANDTGGNIGTSADYFIAGISRVPVQFNIINNNSEGLPVNLTIYFTGTDKEVYEHDFTGIYLDMHTTLLYDLNYRALDGNLSVRLNEVNLSLDNNRTIGLDRFTTLSGYLVTYGINNTYSFTNALITMSYLGTGYTNESYLGLYRCSSWDFAARTCSGTWDAVSGTQDETAKTFTLTTTGFSAYSIKQEAVPSPPSPSGPSEGGPSAGAEWWLSNRRINISITGNCTGKDVIIKVTNPILNESNASIPGVQINILSNSTNLTTTTDINGIAIFRPVSPGVYTLLFSKQHYAGSQINYSIFSCPVAAPEKEKPVVLIEYKPEIYKETKSPILTTVALILAGLLVLFIVLKIAVMRRREREFHHKFNVRHAHVHNGRLIIHRHS